MKMKIEGSSQYLFQWKPGCGLNYTYSKVNLGLLITTIPLNMLLTNVLGFTRSIMNYTNGPTAYFTK